jgi:hypothetical protein
MSTFKHLAGPSFTLIFLILSGTVCGKDATDSKLPPRLQQILPWLPVDSETLIVEKGPYLYPHYVLDEIISGESNPDSSATLEEGLLRGHLQGWNVMIDVEGSRRFRSPKDFGSYPFEGCSILQFEDAADEALQKAVASCLEKASQRINVEGVEVAVFTQKSKHEEWSIFIARPQQGILLQATNREYLAEVLRRMKHPPKDRAFPDALPEWRHVDTRADWWGLRHYRREGAEKDPSSPLNPNVWANDSQAVGFTFSWNKKNKQVVHMRYLSDARDPLTVVNRVWEHLRKLIPTAKIVQDGVVEMIARLSEDEEKDLSLFLSLLRQLGHGVVI